MFVYLGRRPSLIQVELKTIASSAAFILYKFFSSFRTSAFSSVGRSCRRLPKVGWLAVLAGRLAGLLVGDPVEFLGGVGVDSDVSIVLTIMITEGMISGVGMLVFIQETGWIRGFVELIIDQSKFSRDC